MTQLTTIYSDPWPAGPGLSTNFRKHTSRNPLQRYFIERFHTVVARQIATVLAADPDCPTPARVVDVGCGEGFTIEYLRARLPDLEFTGVDSDPDALTIATLRVGGAQFGQARIEDLPFPDGGADLVLCLEVLEHLPQPEAALREILRISRRHVVLSVPEQPFFAGANLLRGRNLRTWGDDPDHRQRWTAAGFAAWVERHCAIRRVCRSFPWTLVVAERM